MTGLKIIDGNPIAISKYLRERNMELSEIHNCEKCQGKIVCITIDIFGITRCCYCNEVVNYKPYFEFIKQKLEVSGK